MASGRESEKLSSCVAKTNWEVENKSCQWEPVFICPKKVTVIKSTWLPVYYVEVRGTAEVEGMTLVEAGHCTVSGLMRSVSIKR